MSGEAGPIIDTDRLTRLRAAAGLSQRQLGQRVGLSPVAGSALERADGSVHGDVSLRTLVRIAEALAVEPSHLLKSEEAEVASRDAGSDDLALEALLAELEQGVNSTQLSQALGWKLDRVESTLVRLRQRLQGTGQRLSPNPGVRLRGRRELVEDAALERASGMASGGRGFDLGCARILRQILTGEVDWVWEAKASNPENVSLRRLVNMGFIRKQDGHWNASADVSYGFEIAAN